jgi:hypothetical protein
LYNFSEEFKKPKELENAMKELELAAKNISMELPSLLYATNSSYTVRASYLFIYSVNIAHFCASLGPFATKWKSNG